MFSRFFIDRPIFAAVLSIVITLAGGDRRLHAAARAVSADHAADRVRSTCNYPGASAKVVAEAVAAPIEQQVNGVEDMMYMSSQCTNDGSYNLTVTFKHGVNLNMAQVLVQNRVNLAMPLLPDVIKQTGVTTRKRSPDILMGIAINSPDGRYDQLYLSNYALMQIKDELARVPGVGDVFLFGQRDYSMRIWVDPDKLAARNLTAGDVVRRHPRAERARSPPARSASRRSRDGQQSQITLEHAGPAERRRAVREHHRQGRRPTAAWSGSRTSAASSWAPRTRTSASASTASRPSFLADLPAARRQRARHRRPRAWPRWRS